MMKNRFWVVAAVVVGTGMNAHDVDAQWSQGEVGWCEDRGGDDQERHCVAFDADFSDPGVLVLDGGQNGGVQVEGWDQDVVSVRAKVWANARDEERAREIVESVRLEMDRGELSAEGPDTGRRESWGVSWEVRVPRATDLDIETMNGGIGVTDVRGTIEFSAVNGGVRLTGVSGDVEGHTTNGGLHVELDGRRWDGAGLDVETTNGGVTIMVPQDYSAELETGTVNGGMDIGFPVMVQGRIGKRLATTLGDGGATVRAVTTNGGVRLVRSGSAIR